MQLIYRNKVRAKKQENFKGGKIIERRRLNKYHGFLQDFSAFIGSIYLQSDAYRCTAYNIDHRAQIILNVIDIIEILDREIYMKDKNTLQVC